MLTIAKALDQEEGIIVGHDNIKCYITEYYKKLFGPREENEISMNDELTNDITQVRAGE